MPDKITKEQRSKNMAAIRSVSKIESLFSKALWANGIRFRRNVRKLFGNPDIAIQKYKIVIFIDSCFWHACPIHFTRPKSNQEYWDQKILRNIKRDREVTKYYQENGWHIKRIWEHSIRKEFENTVKETVLFIHKSKSTNLKGQV
ncbi:very short patch repair endonuclease [Lederbergia wuyishanensis]|uniref:Very short patch repair endonuclease n=1 Tax=Lederbergia wuyishanensis TaxID=1347903 RepID=A0ABU0D2F5_9BACI|nr:very short patch repair endonuclease [Lederbergia wuyishanensis]MCJ8007278.1 very short patch repair endonuclease [Lederbergia wuyishanensis]MDQ0342567.1 DNA mismatch endonuclease (patch repair protein) [Lederbergia wuyishanensis]